MTSKHTPGPWAIGIHRKVVSQGWAILAEDGSALAFVLGDKSPELRTNADLVAAAPDLLLALEKARGALIGLDHRFENTPLHAEITAVVKKATGAD